MFRYKKSVPVSYERQGYIYFASRLYRELTEEQQHKLLNLCLQCGGEHYHALYAAGLVLFLTTFVFNLLAWYFTRRFSLKGA